MLTPTALKALLQEQGLRLTKRLGQHHLIDARAIERIVDRCALTREDTVVEIGPGLGALTEPLAHRAGRVVAVEVDRRIAELLRTRLALQPNVDVRCEDILDFSWKSLGEVVVVGAIPYHITSSIIVALSEARQWIRRAILIVQKEVADRLLAVPGTKAYGRLSVLGQYSWGITPLFRVVRSAFFPQPAVDSTCVQLIRRAQRAVELKDEQRFFGIVKAAFAQRRKTLINCLSARGTGAMSREDAEALVQALGLPQAVRGETLSLAQFAALVEVLGARGRAQEKK